MPASPDAVEAFVNDLGRPDFGLTRLDTRPDLCGAERTDACWEWAGQDWNGYPIIGIGGRQVSVARLVFSEFREFLDEQRKVERTCKNKKCLNPKHLRSFLAV